MVNTYNSTFTNNIFSSNEADGCQNSDVCYCNFTFNQFENNGQHGILFDTPTSNNNIHHNRFIDNGPSENSQASDSGQNNIWYDMETEEGNYWSEWEKKKPYQIDGSAQSQDLYPLDETLTRISFSFLSFLICIPILVIIINKQKKKKSAW